MLISSGNLYSKAETYSLAIVPFHSGTEISKKQSEEISNLIRKKLKPLYKLTSKNLIQKTYKEHPQELLGCIGAECALKVAKLTNSDKALFANIYKIEQGSVVKIIIMDHKTGYIEFSDEIIIKKDADIKKNVEKFSQNVQSHLYGVPWKHDESRFPYIWRSSLFPGYGQWHEGNSFKAKIFAVTGAILLTNYYLSNRAYIHAGEKYATAITIPYTMNENALAINALTLSPLKSDLKKKEQYMLQSAYVLGLFWIGNILDAAFFKYSASDRVNFSIYYNRTMNSMGIKNSISENFKFTFLHHF